VQGAAVILVRMSAAAFEFSSSGSVFYTSMHKCRLGYRHRSLNQFLAALHAQLAYGLPGCRQTYLLALLSITINGIHVFALFVSSLQHHHSAHNLFYACGIFIHSAQQTVVRR
jgi:hypothetical protein